MHNSGIASLHAGLIERARSTAEPIGILKLKASNATPVQVAGPVNLPKMKQVPTNPISAPKSLRRYGLTLRVDPQMRRDLTSFTEHTGRTVQSVLHSALSGYLNRANDIMNHKK